MSPSWTDERKSGNESARVAPVLIDIPSFKFKSECVPAARVAEKGLVYTDVRRRGGLEKTKKLPFLIEFI